MTYQRYKAALEMIAGGCPDPAAVATEALRSRVIEAKPRPPQDMQRIAEAMGKASRERALALFEDWLADGKPTYSKYAKKVNLSPTRVGQIIHKAIRIIFHRKGHPLYDEALIIRGYK